MRYFIFFRLTCCLLLSMVVKGLNVLALHGKGGSAISFEQKLKPLITTFSSHNFHFIDAPFILDSDRIRLNTENRQKKEIDNKKIDRAWWVLPPDVRSFEAKHYEGVEKSLQLIEDSIKDKQIDILVGHSQGGIITSIVAARSLLGISKDVTLKGCLISSPSWPLPFDNLLLDLKKRKSDDNKMLTIHTIGKEDKVNPPEHSYRVADCFRSSSAVHLIEHNEGHILPLDHQALSIYSKLFIL